MSDPCFFLDKLPAEMRNIIYEMTFAAESDADEEVELREAAPPSKGLILSCRQIYKEANQLYKSAYRNYWRTTKFKIYRDLLAERTQLPPPLLTAVVKAIDINHIRKLTLSVKVNEFGFWHIWELKDPRGCWLTVTETGGGYVTIVARPGLPGELHSNSFDDYEEDDALDFEGMGITTFPSVAEQMWFLIP